MPVRIGMIDGVFLNAGATRRSVGIRIAAAGLFLLMTMANAAAPERDVPQSVPQGGLIRGRLPPGSGLTLLPAPAGEAEAKAEAVQIRVAADGRFVLGVGRDETGPIRLDVTQPDGSYLPMKIDVVAREWKIERVEGVPEDTVNPPPEIAARIEREQAEVAEARKRDDDRDDFSADFDWPLTGRISGMFGSQRIYNGTPKSPHSGLDVAAAKGTPVHAPAGGIITFAKPDLYLTGGTVLIDHGHGLSSSFLHLSRIDVKVGDRVEQGQVIGLVGATGRATGPHMHWGLNWFGVRVDPQLLVDPAKNPAVPSTSAAPSR
jgi:murein DD-endopeptidase MepM/ murein hydrolase activator NlpD